MSILGLQRHWGTAICLTAALSCISCDRGDGSGSGAGNVEGIALQGGDGIRITGALYRPSAQGPPGVILVHDAGSSRASWDHFPERLRAAGYLCLALDLAGHGGSTGSSEQPVDYRNFRESDWAARTADIESAVAYLIRAGCDGDNIGIVGAGFGANLALAAASEIEVHSLALLSPGLELYGVRTESLIEELPQIPILIMASEGDSYAARSGEQLKSLATGFCEYRAYPGSFRGAALLAGSESASAQTVQWLEQTLNSRITTQREAAR